MTEEEQKRYYELYTMLWKLLRKALSGMTTTTNMEKFANDIREEALVLLEEYHDLDYEAVYGLTNSTVILFNRAYESLPQPEREAEQMDIFTIGKQERAQAR